MEDKELLRQLRRGDELAAEAIIDRYGAYVAAVVHRSLGKLSRPEDVEGLSSDVFFSLWQHRGSLRGDNIRPWLAAVARNRARSFLRSLGELPSELDESELPCTDSTEMLAEKHEEERELRCAVDALAEPDREIFMRHYYRGESVAQIAAATGLHPENVKTRLRRGRVKLKKYLEKGGRKK